MRFWDSSALVPLLITEDTSQSMETLFQDESGDLAGWEVAR